METDALDYALATILSIMTKDNEIHPIVTPYNNLGNISDIFHSNNQNHWLERRVQPSRSVP